ncbi:unnamed protein product [Diatraea saccharalis]|uniref:Ig-like domain-containing protein n=1 Tax=Diatraea saccharalis TaxID=40085 RepID=A0A9N9WDB3_9NEOP|nr:unnamed protein product [Diatraea saccharalis]
MVDIFVAMLVSVGGFQQQYFRVVPRSLKVQEGSEAVLECAVANLAGQVQWAKDGFALVYNYAANRRKEMTKQLYHKHRQQQNTTYHTTVQMPASLAAFQTTGITEARK